MFHHKRGLRYLLKDDNLLEEIEEDWTTSQLSDSRKTMLNFAVKLTNEPKNMEISDINKLREVDFSDRDILDIVEAYCRCIDFIMVWEMNPLGMQNRIKCIV